MRSDGCRASPPPRSRRARSAAASGQNVTPEVEAFEARMAAHHRMAFRVYAGRDRFKGAVA
jgi:hypothetical protein